MADGVLVLVSGGLPCPRVVTPVNLNSPACLLYGFPVIEGADQS